MSRSTGHVVVIGASAGGIEALSTLLAGLAPDFPAPLLAVVHLSPDRDSSLDRVLARSGPLPVRFAADGEALQPGHVHLAPPDHHLLVQGSRVLVRKGPKENRFRPSIDALFRSAAYAHGPCAIGVVLSGALDDGTAGMWDIKCVGGTTIVQNPEEAAFPSMPQSVREHVEIDHCLSAAGIGALLSQLIGEPAMEQHPENPQLERMKLEFDIAAGKHPFREGVMRIGTLSPFTCPECHGVLMEVRDGSILRFRCHTGHAYSAKTLLAAAQERIEHNYGQAMASLEEAALLLDGLGHAHSRHGDEALAANFFDQARSALDHAGQLREAMRDNALFQPAPPP